MRGVHRTFASGVTCRQGTLSPQGNWYSPIWDSRVLLIDTNPFPEFVLIFSDYALRTPIGTFSIFRLNLTSWMAVVTQTESAPNRCMLVKIANYHLLYWWMNGSTYRGMQLRNEWTKDWTCVRSLTLASLSLTLVSYILYYVNFRFHNGPDMSSVFVCFLGQFGCYTYKFLFLQKYIVLCMREVCKRFLRK